MIFGNFDSNRKSTKNAQPFRLYAFVLESLYVVDGISTTMVAFAPSTTFDVGDAYIFPWMLIFGILAAGIGMKWL